jgi:hypothetical protein
MYVGKCHFDSAAISYMCILHSVMECHDVCCIIHNLMGFNGTHCAYNCFTLFSIICIVHVQNSYPFCHLIFIEFFHQVFALHLTFVLVKETFYVQQCVRILKKVRLEMWFEGDNELFMQK